MSLDLFDGPIARQTETTSLLGQLLDPLSDKVCHLSIAIAVAGLSLAPWWIFEILLIKEITLIVVSLRCQKEGGSKWFGKIGTVMEMVIFSSIFFFFLPNWIFVALGISQWLVLFMYILV